MLIYCARIGYGDAANVPACKKITPQRTAAYSLLKKAMEDFGADARLAFGVGGRPLAAEGGAFLSLSHTKTHALAAVSAYPLGADIETLRPVGERLARRVLTERELREWQSGPPERFFDYWTLKESAYKLCGGEVTDWEFELEGESARLAGRPGVCCRLLRGAEGCAAAVCFEEKDALPELRMLG